MEFRDKTFVDFYTLCGQIPLLARLDPYLGVIFSDHLLFAARQYMEDI